ncbi:MAG: hypothetical protein P1U34_10435 [Coxiellaceae bacterium]|nr:hypothetical protein [Coxiellaceae bacterium]
MKKKFIMQFEQSLFDEYTTDYGKLVDINLLDREYATADSMEFFATLSDFVLNVQAEQLNDADDMALFDFVDALSPGFDWDDCAEDIRIFMRIWIKNTYRNENTFGTGESILDIPVDKRFELDGYLFNTDELCARMIAGGSVFENPHLEAGVEFSKAAQVKLRQNSVLMAVIRLQVEQQRKFSEEKLPVEAKVAEPEPVAPRVGFPPPHFFATAAQVAALTEEEVHAVNLIPPEFDVPRYG